MSRLIGKNPNQVPTNSDLGTLAYQNADNLRLDRLVIDDTLANVTIGKLAFYNQSDAAYNVHIGKEAGYTNTTTDGNVAIGYQALYTHNPGGVGSSVAIGYKAGYALDETTELTAVGYQAAENLNATGNVAIGRKSLQGAIATATGVNNVAVGESAMRDARTAFSNVAVGKNALIEANTASYNVAIGQDSLFNGQDVDQNVAIGYQALYDNVSGPINVAVGYRAAFNTTGQNNVAVGASALYDNIGGNNNVALGESALFNNTSGASNIAIGINAANRGETGDNNVAIGKSALLYNVTGERNTAVGAEAMLGVINNSSEFNTAIGYRALYGITTGAQNTVIGDQAGQGLTTGGQNTFIGDNSGEAINTGTNNSILGRFTGNDKGVDIRGQSYQVVLSDGNGNITYWSEHVSNATNRRWHNFAPIVSENSTGYQAGSVANTWHEVTNIDWNESLFTQDGLYIFSMTFYNGNPTYGYSGRIVLYLPGAGSNTSYTGECVFSSMPDGTMGYEIPVHVASHTGTTSLVWRARMKLTGTRKRLELYSNATQNSGYAPYIQVLKLKTRVF